MSLPRLFAACCAILAATAASPVGPAPTWLGVTIGEPVTQLRAQFGDPLLIRPLGNARIASFLREDDPSAVINVTEEHGVVFAVEYLRERPEQTASLRDPYGATLGMKADDVRRLRGKPSIDAANALYYPVDADALATIVYRFEDDVLSSIKLIGSPANAPGDDKLPHIAEAKGDSYADAVLDVSAKPGASVHFRERYFAVRQCDATGRSTTTEKRTGKIYALVTATCDGKKRTVYFDTTRSTQ